MNEESINQTYKEYLEFNGIEPADVLYPSSVSYSALDELTNEYITSLIGTDSIYAQNVYHTDLNNLVTITYGTWNTSSEEIPTQGLAVEEVEITAEDRYLAAMEGIL